MEYGADDILSIFRLKMKRPPTVKMYRKHLDELYAEALAEEEKESGKNGVRAKL